MPRARLSAAEARRIALAAQGFADAAPAASTAGHLRRVVDRVGARPDRLGQRARARALPAGLRPARRLRPRRCSTEPRTDAPRRLFEYWGHEASLLAGRSCSRCCAGGWSAPTHEAWGGMRADRGGAAASSLERRARAGRASAGPLAAARARRRARRRKPGPWWDWSRRQARARVPVLERRGDVARARRGFERLYDLPERVLPARGARRADPDARTTPSASSCAIAARALGVATERDLRDYFRLPAAPMPAARRRAGRGGRAAPGRGRGLGAAGLPRTATRRCRARRRRPRAARPVRLAASGSATAPSGCSASATGSRSTSRRPSASTATTCCRSCSATASSRASTSRPTARPGVLRVHAAHARARRAAGDGRGAARRSSSCMAGWLGLTPAVA